MAISEVSICNYALALLSANRITSLGDTDSIESLWCEDIYEEERDALLEEVNWTFAATRVQLAGAADAPAFGWDYKVELPGDVIRVVGVWGDEAQTRREKYQREGTFLLVHNVPVYVTYIKRETNPPTFSAGFRKALSYRIAARLCVPLTEDMKREGLLMKQAEMIKDIAAGNDGSQGSQERLQEMDIINNR